MSCQRFGERPWEHADPILNPLLRRRHRPRNGQQAARPFLGRERRGVRTGDRLLGQGCFPAIGSAQRRAPALGARAAGTRGWTTDDGRWAPGRSGLCSEAASLDSPSRPPTIAALENHCTLGSPRGRWIKEHSAHGHDVAAHNGPRPPPFAQRFAVDPEAVDAILFQEWGARDEADGWLATGIEDSIGRSLGGWRGAAVFAEWGSERNPEFAIEVPSREWCDIDHTRLGAWRGAFSGLGLVHGCENSWCPRALLGVDQAGIVDVLQVRGFFVDLLPFARLRRAPSLLPPGEEREGRRPLALTSEEGDIVADYLATGGEVALPRAGARSDDRWFAPWSRYWRTADGQEIDGRVRYVAPGGGDRRPWELSWCRRFRAGSAGSGEPHRELRRTGSARSARRRRGQSDDRPGAAEPIRRRCRRPARVVSAKRLVALLTGFVGQRRMTRRWAGRADWAGAGRWPISARGGRRRRSP